MDGTFGLRGRLAFDTHNLDGTAFEYDVNDRCRLARRRPVRSRQAGASHRTFEPRRVLQDEASSIDETTGPGSAELDGPRRHQPLHADRGSHDRGRGLLPPPWLQPRGDPTRASSTNIKARRFIRGASTITMQLAKNLFLSREKTLSRKLEELILADYLEQAFTKEEMMELYLNVIEFGPDLYGVGAAAQHYFGRRPNELNLAECLFLSSILPNPIAFHKVYEDGQLGEGWMRTIRARMQVAAQVGLISPLS